MKEEQGSSEFFFIRPLVPKAASSNTITMAIRFQHMNLGWGDEHLDCSTLQATGLYDNEISTGPFYIIWVHEQSPTLTNTHTQIS